MVISVGRHAAGVASATPATGAASVASTLLAGAGVANRVSAYTVQNYCGAT